MENPMLEVEGRLSPLLHCESHVHPFAQYGSELEFEIVHLDQPRFLLLFVYFFMSYLFFLLFRMLAYSLYLRYSRSVSYR